MSRVRTCMQKKKCAACLMTRTKDRIKSDIKTGLGIPGSIPLSAQPDCGTRELDGRLTTQTTTREKIKAG